MSPQCLSKGGILIDPLKLFALFIKYFGLSGFFGICSLGDSWQRRGHTVTNIMRILQLMKWLSPREDTGGEIRSFRLGKAIASFARVDAAGFVLPEERIDGKEEHLSHYSRLYPVLIQRASCNSLNFLSGIAHGRSLRSARFFDLSYRRFVEKILQKNRYDAIQVEELPRRKQPRPPFPEFSGHLQFP